MPMLHDSPSQCTATEPTVFLLSGATKKILWSPPFDHPTNTPRDPDGGSLSGGGATTSVLPPAFAFPEEILSEARALTSFAFSRTVQIASAAMHDPLTEGSGEQNAKSRPQPIISLYYPHSGCHDIIDSIVQYMAHDHGADVLVLDSLEMALQEFGAFGKEFAHATDMLYKAPDTSNKDTDKDDHNMDHDPTIQKIFDDIIDIRQEPGVNHDESNSVEQTKPRIVYMRDFGGIASSASLLVPYLLQALQTRRTAKYNKSSPDCAGPFQPTALVLGFSEPPNTRPESDDDSSMSSFHRYRYMDPFEDNTKRVSKGFALGTDLVEILPSLDSKLFALKNRTFPPSHFSSAFFLPSLTDVGELTTDRLVSKATSITNLMLSTAAIFVFTKDSDTEEFRKIEQRMACSRKQAVRNAWMTVCLGRRGAVVSENLLDSILSDHIQTSLAGQEPTSNSPDISEPTDILDDLVKRTGLLLPIFLDRIATLALGLSISQSFASMIAIQVTPPKVSEACQLLIKNRQARSDWTKAVMNDEKDEDEKQKGEEKTADLIVQNVKKADDLNPHERQMLNCIVDGAKLETRFSDVCIAENIIDSLRTVVSLPLLHPSAFKIGILGREAIGGVLLYGPPGTGKTLLCRALARECGARMLQLKPSDINDCFVGESEKLARATFSLAYRLAPCVIFIDEIDSLFKARTGKDDRQYQRDLLNEFLQSMDGLQSAKKNKDNGVVVVGATNRPHDLDDAILRRLATRMMVDLPNEGEREQILRLHLRDEQLGEGVDLHSIARQTQHYSGSDLKALCVSAAMASVKDAVGDFSWTPHTPCKSNSTVEISDPAITPTVSDGAKSTLQTRIISPEHFTHAITEVSPSSSAGSHSELQRWHDKFGRKRTSENRAKPQSNGHLETRTHGGNDGRKYHWRQT